MFDVDVGAGWNAHATGIIITKQISLIGQLLALNG